MQKEAFLPPDAPPEDMQKFYVKWAVTYDKDLSVNSNWPSVRNVVRCFINTVGIENKSLKIVDLGAGTGMVAIELQKFGFTNIDALDGSEPMLEKAKEKNLYKKYMCNLVTAEKLDIPTGTYDALISCGTITGGHVKAYAFPEIIRWMKEGGVISFTIRKDAYDKSEYGYKKQFDELVSSGKWQEIHREIGDYCTNGHEVQRKCYILCYKVLKNE